MKGINNSHGKIVGIALLFTLMMVLSSVSAFASAPGTRQSDELTLRIAMQDDVKGLNPITVSDVWSWNVLGYLYDGTINVNPDTDALIPYVAIGSANITGKIPPADAATFDGFCNEGNFAFTPKDTWGANTVYGEAVIFYDFEDIVWHDGHQMDIRDILFSNHMCAQVPEWSSSMNPLKDMGGKAGTNYTTSAFLHIYKVWESPDHKQAALKFILQEAYAGFFRDTLSTFLLPEHIWAYKVSGQAVDGAKIWCDPGFSLSGADSWKVAPAQSFNGLVDGKVIGNGPFKFDFRETGQFIKVLTFREHFFDENYKYTEHVLDQYGESLAVMPSIEAITYKIYKTADAAVLALKNKDIDYIAWSVPPSYVQDLGNTQGVEMTFSSEPGFFYLAYNMRLDSFGYKDGNPANGDGGIAFRKAVAHCIDKNRVVSKLLLNLGVAADGPVSSFNLDWYNKDYIVRYNFDPNEAKRILAEAGYKVKKSNGEIVTGQAAIDAAGIDNWWINEDGTPIGSSPGGLIEILTPEANYDPIRAQAGLMIAEQLRNVGIYAESVAMDFGSIVDRIDARDFDMFILGWSIGSDPTDFLWAFFHSSQSAVGQNYNGYQNPDFDVVIDAARQTGDPIVRKQKILECLTILTEDLPYDVLYFRTNIEAYRADRFVGWEVGRKGSIYNWDSLCNLRAPSPFKANAQFVTPPSAMTSNKTQDITILVKDQAGAPIVGAKVWVNASLGSLSITEGLTLDGGRFVTEFTAPVITVPDQTDPTYHDIVYNGTQVILTIEKATFTSGEDVYDPAPQRIHEIKVFPEGQSFLSVSMVADPDTIDDIREGAPGFTIVEVTVTDENGDPVADSKVTLSASPALPTIDQAEKQTDDSGIVTFTVTAQDLAKNDDSTNPIILTAVAEDPDDANVKGSHEITLNIIDKAGAVDPNGPTPFPTFLVVASVFCIASVSYAAIRRKKN
ncbi:MAG: ABC transporter substrate-binding protein [Thermoplasmata archaeon]